MGLSRERKSSGFKQRGRAVGLSRVRKSSGFKQSDGVVAEK